MDAYKACAIIEGFDFQPASASDQLKAWAYLIKSGQCWSLQGFYGRTASNLIDEGLITRAGVITPAGRELVK